GRRSGSGSPSRRFRGVDTGSAIGQPTARIVAERAWRVARAQGLNTRTDPAAVGVAGNGRVLRGRALAARDVRALRRGPWADATAFLACRSTFGDTRFKLTPLKVQSLGGIRCTANRRRLRSFLRDSKAHHGLRFPHRGAFL